MAIKELKPDKYSISCAEHGLDVSPVKSTWVRRLRRRFSKTISLEELENERRGLSGKQSALPLNRADIP